MIIEQAFKEDQVRRFYCEQPLILLAILLVALNDHVLKASPLAGFITGKLSDGAGLFFFPFLINDIASLVQQRWRESTGAFLSATIFTGLGFTALKCSPRALQLYRDSYAKFGLDVVVVQDLTDLYALIMLPLAVLFRHYLRGRLYAAR